ncbi:unnamed protein product [Paramecium sonneborni]|uniref:Cullin family profile domain-containing protein n=1 Tax=Paramecium sonneborni TaxID=65129 RepID=A0A8S1RAA3_9CILI|nr:unnamed protein product [Paramecium sonneborni]
MRAQDIDLKASFDKQYKELEKKCLDAAKSLQNSLFSEESFKMSKDQVMQINSQVLQLSSQWSIKFPRNASKQQDDKEEGMEGKLINLYKKCLKEFVDEIYKKLQQVQNERDTTLYLVAKHYHDYKAFSYWLYKLFFHLDSNTASTLGADLHSLSLEALKQGYFSVGQEKLINTILQVLLESRQKEIFLDKKVKSLCELFVVMGSKTVKLKYEREQGLYDYICLNFQETETFYKNNFEIKFIDDTVKYYKKQISERQSISVIEFVRWATKVFKLEETMCLESYPKSFEQISKQLIQLFVIEQAKRLSENGVQYFISAGGLSQLGELYNLISRNSDSVKYIADEFQITFTTLTKNVNTNYYNDQQQQNKQVQAEGYCNSILELMDKAQNIIKNYMQNDHKVQSAYLAAFTAAFNEINDSPFFLALFSDLLIKAEKGINETETDKKLNKIVSLFQLLYSKDKFLSHHQRFLQHRLLNPQSQNLNFEKTLLQKFKGETQTNVLTQLQNMVNDIEQSQRFAFEQKIEKNQQFELGVYLLSYGCWPFSNVENQIIAPEYMKKPLQLYQDMYLQKNNGRIVEWTFNYGQGEVTYKIKAEKYYFSLNTLQMIAFLLFNQADQFTIEQILEKTQIKKFDLENSLIPFICLKVLQREKSDLEEFADQNEIIKLNSNFNNKAKKMKMIPNTKMQPKRQGRNPELTAQEREQEEQLTKQREFVIDSQLVRIMKSKKTIAHKELVDQCQFMVTIFKPDIKFIKKRIENLIEREYIKRDDKDWNIYHYQN